MTLIISQKTGTLGSCSINARSIDLLPLEWYETAKRILHKKTAAGREVIMKFMKDNPGFSQDDVVYENDAFIIAVDILPCEAIVVKPETMYSMASLCYEIGNKHMPLFFDRDEVLSPYEAPLYRSLAAGGFEPRREWRKLLYPLKTTVAPHGQSSSLFSRIMQLTTPSPDA